MNNVIVYQSSPESVAVVIPAPNCQFTIDEIAMRDVPVNAPWRIMDNADLPSRSLRDRWRWTPSGPLAIAPETP